jgi:hypothetical protein
MPNRDSRRSNQRRSNAHGWGSHRVVQAPQVPDRPPEGLRPASGTRGAHSDMRRRRRADVSASVRSALLTGRLHGLVRAIANTAARVLSHSLLTGLGARLPCGQQYNHQSAAFWPGQPRPGAAAACLVVGLTIRGRPFPLPCSASSIASPTHRHFCTSIAARSARATRRMMARRRAKRA